MSEGFQNDSFLACKIPLLFVVTGEIETSWNQDVFFLSRRCIFRCFGWAPFLWTCDPFMFVALRVDFQHWCKVTYLELSRVVGPSCSICPHDCHDLLSDFDFTSWRSFPWSSLSNTINAVLSTIEIGNNYSISLVHTCKTMLVSLWHLCHSIWPSPCTSAGT